MKTKQHLLSLLLATALALPAQAAQVVTVQTAAFRLDLRPSPRTVEAGASETLEYSARWADPAHPAASVKIALDGADFATLPGDEGSVDWTPNHGGLFTFTHTALDGSGQPVGSPYTASFLVENFAFGPDDVTATPCQTVYDGAGHGITVACAVAGATVTYATSQNGPYGNDPLLFTNAVQNAAEWYVVKAPFYQTTTNHAAVTITPRPLAVAAEAKSKVYGTADPALTYTADGLVAGEALSGALSREAGEAAGTYAIGQGSLVASGNYDLTFTGATFTIEKATLPRTDRIAWGVAPEAATFLYDGAEHGVALTGLPDGVTATYEGASAVDAGNYTATAHLVYDTANYEPIADPAPLAWSIARRPITLFSASKDKPYDGWPLEVKAEDITVAGSGYAPGECFTYGDFASLTDVGEIPATFSYADSATAKVANYEIVVHEGELRVTNAQIAPYMGLHRTVETTYDGQAHSAAVEAAGYETVVGSETVTVTQKELTSEFVWIELPAEDYVYDGTEKRPTPGWGDGEESILTEDDFEVAYADNVDAGTATATFTGKRNYCGTVEEEFDILKADNGWVVAPSIADWTYGRPASQPVAEAKAGTWSVAYSTGARPTMPGDYTATFTVPETRNYKALQGEAAFRILPATIRYVSEGVGGPYCGEGYRISVSVAAPSSGATVKYARSAEGPWVADLAVTNVWESGPVWYRIEAAGYATVTNSESVTITQRELTSEFVWIELPAEDYVYDGTEKRPTPRWGEGDPSILTEDDFEVAYVGNVDAGTATATFTGKRNYYGTVEEDFDILPRPATVRSSDATWTFDTTAHSKPEVAASGFLDGQGVAARDFPSVTDVTPAEGVPNAFAYDWNAGTRAGNYALTVEFGTLRVTPRLIGDDDANWDIRLGKNPMYDGTEKTAPISQVCYVKPDGNLENIPYTVAGNKATDAGNYTLTITGTGNYAGSVERGWAVMPRNLLLASGSATWTYDGAAHSETAVTVGGDGFAEGEGADFTGFPAPDHVADATSGVVNAFTWTFRPGTKASNYEVRTTFGTVRMTRRAISLAAPTKTKPYDGTPLTFDATEVAVGGDGYAPGESFALSNFASITDAGQCAATFEYASGSAATADYDITVESGATLTVTRSEEEIVVQAGSGSWTYDGMVHSNRTWTATNLDALVAGDRLEVTFDETSVVATPIDGPEGDGMTTNRIADVRVLRGNGTDVTANYTLSWYPGTLRSVPRPVTLTSASAEKPYDGTPLVSHEATVGGDGFAGTDGVTFAFTGSQTIVGSSPNAFTWAFQTGTNPAFYDVATVAGTLSVTALDIGSGDETDWTVELGPSLTYNGIEQIQTVRAATFRGLPVDYAVEDDRATDAGDYALTLVGQGNFTGRWTVPWRIAPKALALAAGSATKVYDGAPLTCGDVAATGFVAGEGATYVCSGSQTAAGRATTSSATRSRRGRSPPTTTSPSFRERSGLRRRRWTAPRSRRRCRGAGSTTASLTDREPKRRIPAPS